MSSVSSPIEILKQSFGTQFASNSPKIGENIVVVGAQYDDGSGNKLMFVHQAITEVKRYRVFESSEKVTVIIFSEEYTQKQLIRLEEMAKEEEVDFVSVSSVIELANYINSMDPCSPNISQKRKELPVSDIDFFSHGIVGSISLGYQTKIESQATLDENTMKLIDVNAFEKGAEIHSYACRTGLGKTGEVLVYPFLGLDESLAQEMADYFGIQVVAYIKRSDYSGTLGTFMERLERRFLGNEELDKSVSRRESLDGATFDPEGALNSVEEGDTPLILGENYLENGALKEDGMVRFYPKPKLGKKLKKLKR